MNSNEKTVLSTQDFFKRNTKEVSLSLGKVIIRKVSEMLFIGLGQLPVQPDESEDGTKTPKQKLMDATKKEIEAATNKINKAKKLEEIETLYSHIQNLQKKYSDYETEELHLQKKVIYRILEEGLVSPAFSLTSKNDECLGEKDITFKEMSFIATEILSFSGLSGGGAEALKPFSEEPENTDSNRPVGDKIRDNADNDSDPTS
jgi:leucyl aminopeptidase